MMGKNKTILLVDDEASMRKNIVDILSGKNYTIIEAPDGEDAIEKAKNNPIDLVLLDINLPKIDGITVLQEIKKIYNDRYLPVIIFTAFGTSERAIKVMKMGAFDYLEKPFELDQFILVIERANNYTDLLNQVEEIRLKLDECQDVDIADKIVGRNQKMLEIFKTIGKVAPTNGTILIQGESGTGKELVANAIQRHSLRKNQPFIKVNCGALPENLLESEFFGHEKGAFTGAINQRKGRFELANGGTIFLDEINNMPVSLQVRLLRVLQEKVFERVGGKESISVDVRIIAATNKDLEQEVKEGRLQEALFYRLNVVRIFIPPLRDRKDDIPLLAKYFTRKYSPHQSVIIPDETIKILQTYDWPGNVRELENLIQSEILVSNENIILPDSLPKIIRERNNISSTQIETNYSFKAIIESTEKNLIINALNKTNWNRTEAAELLQINRRLLYSKMKEYNLSKNSDK